MLRRSLTVRWLLVLSIAGTILMAISHETIRGLWDYRFSTWTADHFIGSKVLALESALRLQGAELISCRSDSFTLATGKRLRPDQRVLRFRNGTPYTWFFLGTASNLGYVVIEGGVGDAVVVDVVRSIQVDSL
jgi:hypothetical protein